jgi:ferrochelatase
MRQMIAAGHRHALAVVLAAYSSYSSCRQYRENIYSARDAAGPDAPVCDKMRVFYNHPEFIAANVERIRASLNELSQAGRNSFHIAFTAHSIPISMAAGCDYQKQLRETCRLIAEDLEIETDRWALVYQSRSGRPEDPWLEPDILDHCKAIRDQGVRHLIIHPVGFLSDHMEVLYDLDDEAARVCRELGIEMVRAATVGTHPRFVRMLGELIQERIRHEPSRRAIGQYGPNHDVCPMNCCPAPARPAVRPASR